MLVKVTKGVPIFRGDHARVSVLACTRVKQVMMTYEGTLKKAGLMDYDDMLSNTLSLLEVPSVGAYVGRQFEHVLVDEFQVRYGFRGLVGGCLFSEIWSGL